MRPGTTITLVLLLCALMAAAVVQFFVLAR